MGRKPKDPSAPKPDTVLMKFRRTGNSFALTVPAHFVQQLGAEQKQVAMAIRNGLLVVRVIEQMEFFKTK